jgi:chromosomal replication initiator protein
MGQILKVGAFLVAAITPPLFVLYLLGSAPNPLRQQAHRSTLGLAVWLKSLTAGQSLQLTRRYSVRVLLRLPPRSVHMKPSEVWQAALGELQLQMTRDTFNTWLKPTRVISYEDSALIIGVENGYVKEWLSNRLLSTIQRTVTSIVGRTVDVSFAVWSKKSENADQPPLLNGLVLAKRANQTQSPINGNCHLNVRYTFDSFVVGPSNRLAHAASLAVAEQPAVAYNPLFLYGGVGLGKTHLLHAIGHECQSQGLQVLYVSSENFTNDIVDAIRTHATDGFREKYRNTDLLLIDDIQFIAGKERTQEEFFHTFNSLHEANKQVVISSDRQPRALVPLEERLRSRFEWGLTADIQPPDLETRVAILSSKANSQSVTVRDDLLYFIAQHVQKNIRELEGALNRVLAYVRLTGHPMTKDTAELALTDMLTSPVTLTPAEIVKEVAQYYNLSDDALRGRARSKEIARSRQIAMYLAREETKASLPQIGEALGRDHTTVLYGYDKISQRIEEDDHLRRDVLTIRERLYKKSKQF